MVLCNLYKTSPLCWINDFFPHSFGSKCGIAFMQGLYRPGVAWHRTPPDAISRLPLLHYRKNQNPYHAPCVVPWSGKHRILCTGRLSIKGTLNLPLTPFAICCQYAPSWDSIHGLVGGIHFQKKRHFEELSLFFFLNGHHVKETSFQA